MGVNDLGSTIGTGPVLDERALSRPELGSDEEVVRRVLGDEPHLFEVIMRRYNQRLYRTTRSILRVDDEAEDVVQDAYVRAYAHLRDFDGGGTFAGWLTRIAVNEALARLRRRKRGESFDERAGEETMAAEDRSPEQGASDTELRGVLEQAIDALPESFRTVFVLRTVEELSTLETAESLGIPEETVKTRLFRARALLQKKLTARLERSASRVFAFERPRCDRLVGNVLRRIGVAPTA